MPSSDYKTALLTSLAGVLLPVEFRRRGANFLRPVDDVVHVVQLQSSTGSSSERAVVTVNLGVFSRTLEIARGGSIVTPTESDCHWRGRLGELTPAARDAWWTVADPASATRVGAEVAAAMVAHGLPALDALRSTAALVALWQSGIGPGLTDRQRRDYLALLARRPGGHPDRVA